MNNRWNQCVVGGLFIGLVAGCATEAGSGEENEIDQGITSACTVTVSSLESTVTIGQPIHLSAVASCPSGTPSIEFEHKIDNGYEAISPFSTTTTLTYDSSAAMVGDNLFRAEVRTSGTTETPAVGAFIHVMIKDTVPSCTAVSLLAPTNGQAGQVGVAMTLTATATCGGVTPEFQFWVKPAGTSTYTVLPGPYLPQGSSGSWTPNVSQEGSINVVAVARAQGAHVQYSKMSAVSTVTIAPPAVDRAPTALPDSITTFRNTAGAKDLSVDASDPDGDPLTYSVLAQGSLGTAAFSGSIVTYTPTTGGSQGIDSFTYQVDDGRGGTASATITVFIVDQFPTAGADSLTTTENQPVGKSLAADTADADGDSLTYSVLTAPSSGSASFVGAQVTYTPNAGFVGSDSFVYQVDDGHGGTASATVSVSVNDQTPIANAAAITTNVNTAGQTNLSLAASDPDGDAITFSVFSGAANGTATVSGTTVTYTPNAGFVGSDSFTYQVTDSHGASATATVSVTVNDLLVIQNDTISTTANVAGSTNVLSNDSDPDGETLSIQSYGQGANGSVSISAAGLATYTPNAGFIGSDSFTYVASDIDGVTGSGTVAVTVAPGAPGCTVSLDGPASTTYGQPIHLVASAACNTGAADVQFYHKTGSGWAIVQAFSSTSTFDYVADAVGPIYFYAAARTHGTSKIQATSATLTVTGLDDATSVCSNPRVTSPANGAHEPLSTDVSLTASATCTNGGTPEYQFWVKLNGSQSWTILPAGADGFTTSTGLWHTAATGGLWNLAVVVRSVGSHAGYQAKSGSLNITLP